MEEDIFLRIRSALNKSELLPYLKSRDFLIRQYSVRRLKELEEDIFDLDDVI